MRVHLPEALQEAFGPTVAVAAGPTDTLEAVAALVAVHTGVPADNLSYSFLPLTSGLPSDSTPLPVTDDKSTLAALGISNGGALGASVAAGAVAVAPAFVIRIRLPPCLQPAFGTVLTLATLPATTVEELHARIAALTGMCIAGQLLTFGNLPLTNDGQTLAEAGVKSGSMLALCTATTHVNVYLPESLQEAFGSTMTVVAGPTDTVGAVTARVALSTGISTEGVLLSYLQPLNAGLPREGMQLAENGATLAALNVPNGAWLGMAAGAESGPQTLIVRVRLPPCLHHAHNSSLTLATSASATVDEVVAQLATLTGMNAAEQQLAFGAVPLINGSQALGSHKLKP